MKLETVTLAGLKTRIYGPADAKVTVVLLHGFGAPGDDLVPLGQFMNAPGARFVYPAAPLELPGMYGESRAWWLIDLMKLEHDLRTGASRDRRNEVPEGLADVRAQMSRFLDDVKARYSITDDKIVLGGFSQGAMLSLDVALHRDKPPAALALMSGTLIAEAEWTPLMPKLAGVPVVQSHGTFDPLLPFSIAEALRDKLVEAGAVVKFLPFRGQHQIPESVLGAVGTLIQNICSM